MLVSVFLGVLCASAVRFSAGQEKRTVRVIAGQFRGRNLVAPEGMRTRPITDRAKESLFNVLGSRLGEPGSLPDVEVLDLFAGSGSLGIEALSRGARSCLFVEKDRTALSALRENVQALKLGPAARIATANAWTLAPVPPTPAGFGLIFVDPPYRDAADTPRVCDLLDRLAKSLSAEGLLVMRHGDEATFSAGDLVTLRLEDERRFGAMHVLLLVHRTPTV